MARSMAIALVLCAIALQLVAVSANEVKVNVKSAKEVVVYEWLVSNYGACSASCGAGTQTRTVACVAAGSLAQADESSCSGNAPATTRTCEVSLCENADSYDWVTSSWDDCTVTCGVGTQTRTVLCFSAKLNAEVQASFCSAKTRPDSQLVCSFPNWNNGEWSECSATCGAGHMYRDVYCALDGARLEDDSRCAGITEMATESDCNLGPCEELAWEVGSYGSCSVTCGEGIQERSVQCWSNLRNYLPLTECPGSQPDDHAICVGTACELFTWQHSSWSDCSATCGDYGIQTREVYCESDLANFNDDGTLCVGLRPDSEQDCSAESVCYSYDWGVTEWVDGATCGEDVQSRTMSCYRVADGVVVDNELCAASVGAAPAATKTVYLADCVKYQWHSSQFGDCTCTCGHLACTQSRSVSCVSSIGTVVDWSYCDGSAPVVSQFCTGLPACASSHWANGEWGSCSATCGSGHVSRDVWCESTDGASVLDDSDCSEAGDEPSATDDCNVGACESYDWVSTPYGPCSVTCGDGLQERAVTCLSSLRGTVTNADCIANIAPHTEPASVETCYSKDCQYFHWERGTWSSCSATCDAGTKTRDVWCADQTGTEFPSTKCVDAGVTKPCTVQTCQLDGCETFSWFPESWSECSISCWTDEDASDVGTQTRSVLCKSNLNFVGTADQCADAGSMPATTQTCEASAQIKCETFEWVTGSWSSCDATCGFGAKTRSVACIGSYGTIDASGALCTAAEPASTKDCIDAVCPVCTWIPSGFSDCDATCGNSVRTREVVCRSQTGEECDAAECIAEQLTTSAACELTSCTQYKWFTGHFGECSVSCGDGTMSRDVYCHDTEGLVVDVEYCAEAGDMPAVDQICTPAAACDGAHWHNGPWFECSSTCGAGTRTRLVYCVDADNAVTDASACSGTGPALTEPCQRCECETWSWEVTSYSDCSVSCGNGFIEREVNCRSSLRGYVSAEECRTYGAGAAPSDVKACVNVCYDWAVGPWGSCSASCDEGTWSRNSYCLGTDGSVDETAASCNAETSPTDTESCFVDC